jgi:sterol desaturase/sphingolipid hydroxylase (fatty acid hydroxylase superfamily)
VRSWALHAGVVAGAAVAVHLDRRVRRRIDVGIPLGSTVVIGACWTTIAVLERRRPFRSGWNQPIDADRRADALFFASTAPVSLAMSALGAGAAARLPRRANLAALPTPIAVAVAIVVYDLFHSQLHRLGHEWGPAWRVHSVHHSPRRLYWGNATRFHAIESALDGLGEGVISAALGMSADQEVAYRTFRALYGQLQHANIEVDSGVLDRVFSTPDLHRWHHSTDYDEGDTNYGAITSVWDQLLGTWFRPNRAFDAEVGVGRMPNFPTAYAELAAVPFRWDAIRQANADTFLTDPRRVAHTRRGGARLDQRDSPDRPVSSASRPRAMADRPVTGPGRHLDGGSPPPA